MAEYIERDAVLDTILGEYPDAHYPNWYAGKIKMLPTVDDVAPVVHGRWIPNTDDFTPANRCSACGYNAPEIAICRCTYQFVTQPPRNYCPSCGALMDGKDGEAGA